MRFLCIIVFFESDYMEVKALTVDVAMLDGQLEYVCGDIEFS
jgi:hypothetical protein